MVVTVLTVFFTLFVPLGFCLSSFLDTSTFIGMNFSSDCVEGCTDLGEVLSSSENSP